MADTLRTPIATATRLTLLVVGAFAGFIVVLAGAMFALAMTLVLSGTRRIAAFERHAGAEAQRDPQLRAAPAR